MTDFKISDLVKIIEDFRKSRGWLENDNPKNVAMGISVEAGELMEHFVWSDISYSFSFVTSNTDIFYYPSFFMLFT